MSFGANAPGKFNLRRRSQTTRMTLLLIWFLAFLQLAVPPALTGTPAPEQIGLSGRVVQAGTDQPVAGALVTLQPSGISIPTDINGQFRLFAPAGRFTLTIERDGFVPQVDPLRGISEF